MDAVTLKDIAGALKLTERAVLKRTGRDGWAKQPREKGKGFVYPCASLPRDVQVALVLAGRWLPPAVESPATADAAPPSAPALPYDRDSLQAASERATQKQRDEAARRLDAVSQAQALMQLGTHVNAACAEVGARFGCSLQSVRLWYYLVIAHPRPDWLALLVPRHVGRTKTAEIPAAAWDAFVADYLRLEGPAASACYDRLQRRATAEGWTLPSCKTFLRRIEREIDPAAVVLAREGTEAAASLLPPQQRDRLHLAALQAVNADGHQLDVFVEWEDGEIGRPVLIGVQDLASGKILAHRLGKSETAHLICLVFGDVVERYGIFDSVYLDNGRGFASKWLTGGTPTRYRFKVKPQEPVGILTQLGTRVHWVTPYHGQAKPIERAWRDLAEYISRHPACSGAYTGPNPQKKPANYGSRAVPIAEFRALVDTEIAAHNARRGRRTPICGGVRSFDEVFAELYSRALIRKASPEQRRLWLLVAESVRADRQTGHITLFDNRYWSEALIAHRGQSLVARFHPERLHEPLHVYTFDGRYIGAAECRERVGFDNAEAAQELARARKRFIRGTKETLAAERRIDALELARQQPGIAPPPPPEQPAVVRGVFKRAAGDGCVADDMNEEDRNAAFSRGVALLRAAKEADRKDRL